MTYNKEDFFNAYMNKNIKECKVIGKDLLINLINEYATNKKTRQKLLNLIEKLEKLNNNTDPETLTKVLIEVYSTIFSC